MKTNVSTLAVLGLAALFSLSAQAEEKELTATQVPKAVHEAFQKAYPAAKGAKYSEETKEGKPVYEVEFKAKGKEIEATYSADGGLMETEEEIKTSELPQAVVQAIKQKYPHAALKEAEKILKPEGTVSGYEVEIVAGKRHLEIELGADGTIVKTETEKD